SVGSGGERPARVDRLVHEALVVEAEAAALVERERAGVVEVAGVHPDPRGAVGPGLPDCPGEEVLPEPPSDELGQESEIGELDLPLDPTVELGVTGRPAA